MRQKVENPPLPFLPLRAERERVVQLMNASRQYAIFDANPMNPIFCN